MCMYFKMFASKIYVRKYVNKDVYKHGSKKVWRKKVQKYGGNLKLQYLLILASTKRK